jgi:hypothetical protein
MSTQLKFKVLNVATDANGRVIRASLEPVAADSTENETFAARNPGGRLGLVVTDDSLAGFAEGRECFIDITLVE